MEAIRSGRDYPRGSTVRNDPDPRWDLCKRCGHAVNRPMVKAGLCPDCRPGQGRLPL